MLLYSPSTGGFYDSTRHRNIPPDALEISKAQHREVIASLGKLHIVVGEDGSPAVAPHVQTPLPAEERRARARAAIDQAAGRARLRHVSPGDLVDQEYREAEAAAKEWQAAGEPAAEVPPEVQTWAEAANMTASAAAQDIIDTGAAWRQVLAQVRDLRLKGKAAVDAAADTDIEATAQGYIDELDALQPAT